VGGSRSIAVHVLLFLFFPIAKARIACLAEEEFASRIYFVVFHHEDEGQVLVFCSFHTLQSLKIDHARAFSTCTRARP